LNLFKVSTGFWILHHFTVFSGNRILHHFKTNTLK
jgi:hypothetical protein